MEPASLAIGIAPLLLGFLEVYEKVHALKGMGNDLVQHQARLALESERVRFIRDTYNLDDNFPASGKPLLIKTLEILTEQMLAIQSLIAKHAPLPSDDGGKRRNRNRITWAMGDKAELDRCLDLLHGSVNVLWWLVVASDEERARNDFLLRVRAVSGMVDGNGIGGGGMPLEGLALQFPGIARAAQVRQLLKASIGQTEDPPSLNSRTSNWKISTDSIRWAHPAGLDHAITAAWARGNVRMQDRNVHVLVEFRVPFTSGHSTQRLDMLCELLQAMYISGREEEVVQVSIDAGVSRTVNFATLECLGWTDTSFASLPLSRIGLVFRYPQIRNDIVSSMPQTLRMRMAATRSVGAPKPVLGDRFDLARGVASAVANIISIGWIHRAIRSENILSFDPDNSAISKLYLIGFAYTRPGEALLSDISDLPEGKDWAFYRLPESTSPSGLDSDDEEDLFDGGSDEASRWSTAAYDMYGLGIVLLEIGIWASAYSMSKDGRIGTFLGKGLPDHVEKLGYRCGAIYQAAVRKCLEPANWGPESLTENLASLLGSLRICRA